MSKSIGSELIIRKYKQNHKFCNKLLECEIWKRKISLYSQTIQQIFGYRTWSIDNLIRKRYVITIENEVGNTFLWTFQHGNVTGKVEIKCRSHNNSQ